MGSVIGEVPCPSCSAEAYDEYYYKTGEEYLFCMTCGYTRSSTINRQKAKKDGIELIGDLTDEYWNYKEEYPLGVVRTIYKSGIGTNEVISKGVTPEEIIKKLKAEKSKFTRKTKAVVFSWVADGIHYQYSLLDDKQTENEIVKYELKEE